MLALAMWEETAGSLVRMWWALAGRVMWTYSPPPLVSVITMAVQGHRGNMPGKRAAGGDLNPKVKASKGNCQLVTKQSW